MCVFCLFIYIREEVDTSMVDSINPLCLFFVCFINPFFYSQQFTVLEGVTGFGYGFVKPLF